MNQRRFPPPWSIEDNGACFIVKDSAGQARPQSSNYPKFCSALTRASDGRPPLSRTVSDPALSLGICESRREFRASQRRISQGDFVNPGVHHQRVGICTGGD